MNRKICIEDIRIEWLNKRSLVLISIFTHALHKHNGVVIDLRAPDVLSQISKHARETSNVELKNIYQKIKKEVRISLADAARSNNAAADLERLLVSPTPDTEHGQRPPDLTRH